MAESAALHDGCDAGARRRRAVRRGDGVPGPLLHGHERARGDAPDRAPIAPQGHPAYRLVAQRMHDLIGGGHPAIAASMTFADHSPVELGRLAAERRSEAKRRELPE